MAVSFRDLMHSYARSQTMRQNKPSNPSSPPSQQPEPAPDHTQALMDMLRKHAAKPDTPPPASKPKANQPKR